ncbi:[4Fe-4S] proteins maturation [Tieghemiomyces parasiticus]|uniref:[4Fe-4S] proteins maturation n=1 Tax=Tieghemiomyces parasiticus TaxID=78921 RepID=A0A9W7ZNU1_9FUNG|nr:[4Fe-4S] proteins maturation [Tieghemiomyces parasiticus]
MQIILTERAGEQLTKVAKDQNKPDLMLRVVVESGGCYGFQYKFKLTTETTDEDAVFENAGGRLVIDDVSLSLLEGATIDYVTELIGSSFQVVKIPKSSSGCGCGTSFDIQL